MCRSVYALSFTAGPTLTHTNISAETIGAATGTAVNFTLDTDAQAAITFFTVSPVDSSLTSVATIFKNASANTPTSVFWSGLWPIGVDLGRHDGTFAFHVAASTTGATVDAPPDGDPTSFFQITSVDIHNLKVTPSLDASHQPTFPYVISYALAKGARVTATVSNTSGVVVRTLISAQPQADETVSSVTVSWDGLGNDGKPVSIGNYGVTVSASDLNTGDQAIPRTSSFTVTSLAGAAANPQKLFEDNVFVYPNPVRNGLGTFQMEAVREGANLSLKIYTLTGDLVREQSFPGVAAGNITTFNWDATNQAGRKVGRGLYYYVAREEDSQGTLQTVKKMAVLP